MGNKSKYVVDPSKRKSWQERRNLSAAQLPKSYVSRFFGVQPPRVSGHGAAVVRNDSGTGIKHVELFTTFIRVFWPSSTRGTFSRAMSR